MALSLLLILTITTLNSGAQSSLPKVSYIKAIDVWFIGEYQRYFMYFKSICTNGFFVSYFICSNQFVTACIRKTGKVMFSQVCVCPRSKRRYPQSSPWSCTLSSLWGGTSSPVTGPVIVNETYAVILQGFTMKNVTVAIQFSMYMLFFIIVFVDNCSQAEFFLEIQKQGYQWSH